MSKKGTPAIYDVQSMIQAGIDPKTGLPLKYTEGSNAGLKAGIKHQLRILDQQTAINRYTRYNAPFDLTSQDIERMLYYKYALIGFWDPVSEEFYLMPFALDGGLDFYGRMKHVHPIPFASGTTDNEKDQLAKIRNYLSTLQLKVLYDIPLDPTIDLEKCCVMLKDYTPQLGEMGTPRATLQEPILDVMADMIPFSRTALQNATGVLGMRVNSKDEVANVLAANQSLKNAALVGEAYVPILGNVDFQEMTGGTVAKAQDYMQTMQSYDNYRLSLYGMSSGGVFEKNAHMLQAEQQMNAGKSTVALEDGLARRQKFCEIFNVIFGTMMSCEITEVAMGGDMNLDGMVGNNATDSAGSPTEVGTGGDK